MIEIAIEEMQMANTVSCNFLTARDWQGCYFHAELCKKKEVIVESVTAEILVQQMEALTKASIHDTIFVVTGGNNFTLDDIIKVAELPVKVARIEELKQNK